MYCVMPAEMEIRERGGWGVWGGVFKLHFLLMPREVHKNLGISMEIHTAPNEEKK